MGRLLDCFFLKITGIPCPGCGLTRAYRALFRGDLTDAFFYHPLFFLIPVIIIGAIWSYKQSDKKRKNFFWLFFATLFLGVYIVRMGMYFPSEEPLKFDQTAIIPQLFHKIVSFHWSI